MKILKKEGNYRKVTNDFIADDLVKKLGWSYSTRAEWKTNVRDVGKKVIEEVTAVKELKKPKKK